MPSWAGLCLLSFFEMSDVSQTSMLSVQSFVCRADEADEAQCECPFCGVAGPETEMDCIHCQNIIPFCIASGLPPSCHV